MVELAEMAKFVNDNIVANFGRQKCQSVTEIQIALTRTTAPSRFLIFYPNLADFKIVKLIEIREPTQNDRSGLLFIFEVITTAAFPQNFNFGKSKHLKHLNIFKIITFRNDTFGYKCQFFLIHVILPAMQKPGNTAGNPGKSFGKNPKNQGKSELPPKPLFPMRINKYLALHKHSTRRGADEMISKKQVFLNDRLAVLGDKVNENDRVEVRFRGKQVPYVYFAYNKPVGIVSHSAQGGDKEIKHVVALRDVFPIGRLDKDSHGLIILTNDGRITERLLGPAHAHEKEYLVKTKDVLRSSFKKNMEGGVKIDREQTGPCKVKVLNDHTFRVILTEGKKHQIRRMCVALFQEVSDLERIRIMNIELGHLPMGSYRPIEGDELQEFLRLLDLA